MEATPTGIERALVAGLKWPTVKGWWLWIRCLGVASRYLIPLAVVLAVILWRFFSPPQAEEPPLAEDLLLLGGLLLVGGFGAALSGVVLSQKHTGLVRGNAIAWTLRRFPAVVATWVLMMLAVIVGYIALVLPGIVLSVRLFWADELALMHERGPIQALRESWDLTRNAGGRVLVFQFLHGLAQYVILLPGMLLVFFLAAKVSQPVGPDDGLPFIALLGVTLVLCFVYGAAHAGEIVQFYGMRAARATMSADDLERDWVRAAKDRLSRRDDAALDRQAGFL